MSMTSLKKIAQISCLASCFALAIPLTAQAGGVGGIVFDPTNYIENGLTAENAINLVQGEIKQYLLEKYGITANLRGLPMQELNQMLINKLPTSQHFVLNYMSLLNDLEHHIGVSVQGVQQQYDAMTASGLSPFQYIDQELRASQSRQAYAAAGFEQATRAMQQVNAQSAVIAKQSGEVGKTVGDTQSMHLMQAQLQTMTQQNQEMLKLLAARQAELSNAQSMKAINGANSDKAVKGFNKAYGQQPAISAPKGGVMGQMLTKAAGRMQ